MNKFVLCILVLSYFESAQAAISPQLNISAQQQQQKSCDHEQLNKCINKCKKNNDKNCISLCRLNAKNECLQAGE